MPTAKELYNKAMDVAEDAFSVQKKGKTIVAYWKFKRALKLIEKSLALIPENESCEATRNFIGISVKSLKYLIRKNKPDYILRFALKQEYRLF